MFAILVFHFASSLFLPWADYVQNSLRHSATHLTPFQCMFGYQHPLLPWDMNKWIAVDNWFWRSEQVWESIHQQFE